MRGAGGSRRDVVIISTIAIMLFPLLMAFAASADLLTMRISNGLEHRGWTTDIRGGLNQPPALGKLMGLDEEQIANAIGICMSHALPLLILDTDREENTMAKNLRFGWVAHDAILACLLAQQGFTGPARIIEAETGIRNVIAGGDMDLEHLIDSDGSLNEHHTSTHNPFGTGKLNFDQLLPALNQAGVPHDWWCVDLCFWPNAWDVTADSKKYLDKLRAKYAAA